ncbi:hypothetical protein BH09BAC1_BH09BAC1_28730 [soil metagenome]
MVVIICFTACNRNTASTKDGNGYGYNQPKSTDPSVYNPKPVEPPTAPASPDTVVSVVEQPPAPPQEPTDEFAQVEPWMKPVAGSYLAVKIKRTPCYGTCPTYTAAIFSDGTAFYFGERFVENLGYFQGKVSLDQLNALIKMGYKSSFFSLAEAYPTDGRYISDLPTTILYINSGVNQKTITDRSNAPEELNVLQDATHTLIESIKWLPLKK